MSDTTDLLNHAFEKNPVDFASTFNQIVQQKAQEAIEAHRITLAQSIYGDEDADIEDVDIADEDDLGEDEFDFSEDELEDFGDDELDLDLDDLDLEDLDLEDEDFTDDEDA
jgi:hypothetical protein